LIWGISSLSWILAFSFLTAPLVVWTKILKKFQEAPQTTRTEFVVVCLCDQIKRKKKRQIKCSMKKKKPFEENNINTNAKLSVSFEKALNTESGPEFLGFQSGHTVPTLTLPAGRSPATRSLSSC